MGIEIRPNAVMGQIDGKDKGIGDLCEEAKSRVEAINGLVGDDGLSGAGYAAAKKRFAAYASVLTALSTAAARVSQIDTQVSGALSGFFGGVDKVSEDEWKQKQDAANSAIEKLDSDHSQAASSDEGCSDEQEASYKSDRAEQEQAASEAGAMLSRIYQYCEQTNGIYGDVDLSDLIDTAQKAMGAISAAGWNSETNSWGELDDSTFADLDKKTAKVAETIANSASDGQQGSDENTEYGGDPVSLVNGNFTWARGYFLYGGRPALTLTYNSLRREAGALGPGWRHSLEASLEDGPDGITVTWGDGSTERFVAISEGVWSESRGRDEYMSRFGKGWRLEDRRGEQWYFDEHGGLGSIVDAFGRATTLERDPEGRVRRAIVRELTLSFSYGDEGRLESVSDDTGRSVSLSYDAGGMLAGIVDETGAAIAFSNEGDLLAELRDEEGRLICSNAYDQDGRVLSQLLPGGEVSYRWDGDTVEVTERDGSVTLHRSDSAGRSTLSVNELGLARARSYDARDYLTGLRAPSGASWSWSRDRSGRATSLRDPTGREARTMWDDGMLPRSVEVDGNVTLRSTSDERGLPVQVSDGSGSTMGLRWDAMRRLVRVTFADGSSQSWDYAGSSRLPARFVDEGGHVTRYEWDAWGNLASVTRPNGSTERWRWDARCRLMAHEPLGGGTETWERDASGRAVAHTDALGQRTCARRDAAGRVSSETEPDGSEVRWEYGPRGELLSLTWPDGGKTSFGYDAAMRLAALTLPSGERTGLSLDADDNIVGIEGPAGTNAYTWDAAGRLTSAQGPRDGEERSYDAQGRLSERRFADGSSVRYEYDAAGRQARLIVNDDYTIDFAYDGRGRLVSREDSLGRGYRWRLDAAGNRVSEDGIDGELRFSYGTDGTFSAVTDAAGNRTASVLDPAGEAAEVLRPGNAGPARYVRDSLGRITSIEDPTGRVSRFEYDAAGNVCRRDDGGVVHEWAYDAMGRAVADRGPAGEHRYAYDGAGNLVEAADGSGTSRIEVDAAGRPTAVRHPDGVHLGWAYDERGNRALLDVDGTEIRYHHDGLGRLARVEAGGGWVELDYDERGNLSRRRWSDGSSQSIALDPAGRLASMELVDAAGHRDSLSYEWDGRDDLVALVAERWGAPGQSGRFELSYDAAGRLTSVSRDGEELERYAYDGRGNRVSSPGASYVYDAADRLVELRGEGGTTCYAYDGAGCLASVEGPAGASLLSLDDAGAPLSTEWAGGGRRRHLRDPLGRPRGVEGLSADLHDPSVPLHSLVRRRTGAGERVYLQTPAGCVGAVDPAGGALEPVMCDLLGQALRVCRGGEFGAALGSMPFGVPLASDPLVPFGAFGYVADPATGLLASPTRLYDPGLGRFLSPDPVGGAPDRPHTLNRYAYSASNPTRYFDPTGGFINLAAGAAFAVGGALVNGAIELGRETLIEHKSPDWGKVGGKALEGVAIGGVAGLTCGASLGVSVAANFGAGVLTDVADQALVEGTAQGRSPYEITAHALIAGGTNALSNGPALPVDKWLSAPVSETLTNKIVGEEVFKDIDKDLVMSATTRGQWRDLLGYGTLEEALSFISSGGMSLAADQTGMTSKLANGLAVLSNWLERYSRYAVVACAQGGR
ncbi:RHS repeat-associated protein [Olsenella profusa DSM 13989]|uniref:RHS repeat-associated core domain-containing protein n=1 Tax=Olsenella profusa TaxID=138595 RepID=UPI00278A6FBB|nr:RHS repeat-associated core domain-containing protein [Olsenella profusa]MDP9859138.1 RHS repeat-associated protein [Olsenella profusa DSM 13989]